MKRIIITTDFSGHSKNTIRYVLEFLKDTQIPCRVTLLNTYLVQQTDPRHIILANDEMKKKSRNGLEAERSEALKLIENENISIDTASHLGSLDNVISQLIRKEAIDLVAMGKDGGKNVETVATLLKREKCPLLITYLQ